MLLISFSKSRPVMVTHTFLPLLPVDAPETSFKATDLYMAIRSLEWAIINAL